MLSADTYVKLRIYRLTKLDGHLHELTNTSLVKLSKWIVLEDLCIIVSIEELTSIITRESKCHLCKVVSTEAEEISFLSDLISCKSSSWDLDHCTNFVLKLSACSSDLSISCLNNYLLNVLKLLNLTYKRNHDFRLNIPVSVCLLNFKSSTDNSLSLHLCNLRVCYCKTAATVTHHRVELME